MRRRPSRRCAHRSAEASGAQGRHPGDLRQRQLRSLAFDFSEVVEHCLHDGVRGQPLAELLAPDREDYFVLKPKHSAFFDDARYVASSTRSRAACPRRLHRGCMRPHQCGRCAYARFRAVRAVGLHRIQVTGGEPARTSPTWRGAARRPRASARLNLAALGRRTPQGRRRKGSTPACAPHRAASDRRAHLPPRRPLHDAAGYARLKQELCNCSTASGLRS